MLLWRELARLPVEKWSTRGSVPVFLRKLIWVSFMRPKTCSLFYSPPTSRISLLAWLSTRLMWLVQVTMILKVYFCVCLNLFFVFMTDETITKGENKFLRNSLQIPAVRNCCRPTYIAELRFSEAFCIQVFKLSYPNGSLMLSLWWCGNLESHCKSYGFFDRYILNIWSLFHRCVLHT